MISVPQAFFDNPQIDVMLRHGQCAILRKETSQVNKNNDRYLAAHALTAVHSGQLVVQAPDGARQVVSPGHMILIPRGIYTITDIIPGDAPFRATVFFFDDDLLHEFFADQAMPKSVKSAPDSPQIFKFQSYLKHFLHGIEQLSPFYGNGAVTRVKLLELLHLVTGSSQGAAFLEVLHQLLAREKKSVKVFMEQHFDKPLKIEDYAYLTGRSVSTFHRDFKRHFDIGPKAWLVQKRMNRAKHMLESDPGLSVTSLALASGYDNVSFFIKTFRGQFSISPKQFQMLQRQNVSI